VIAQWRPGAAVDLVGGVPARFVAVPGDVHELAELLSRCADDRLTAVARGDGSKLDWGHPPSTVDVVVDTTRLAGVSEHQAGDLVATVGAGTPIDDVQAVLARSGQRLALDPPSHRATVGGALATGEFGPLGHRYGGPRDLLIGVEFVRADGTIAHSGGRVVKNVAGYDLGKLLCGSYGTLGVITSATFRLHPLPAHRSWVVRSVQTPGELGELITDLTDATLEPTAIEEDLPPYRPHPIPRQRNGGVPPPTAGQLAVLFEGSPVGVPARCQSAVEMLGGDASIVDEQPSWWGQYPFGPGDIALRLCVPAADLYAVIYALRDVAGIPVPVRGSAGIGVVHAALPGTLPPDRGETIIETVRTTLLARSGSCVVLTAPEPLRKELDLWGPIPGLDLMRRVKERFDPARLLSPGRFVGGI
jgi:glycolate oxidase FAD binding subunit